MRHLPRLVLLAATVLAGGCYSTREVPFDKALGKLGDAPEMGLPVEGYVSVNGIVHPETATARLVGSDTIAFTPQFPGPLFPETVLLSENQVRGVCIEKVDGLKVAGLIVALPILIPIVLIALPLSYWLPNTSSTPSASPTSRFTLRFGVDYPPRPKDWPIDVCVLERLRDKLVELTGVEPRPLPADAQLLGSISVSSGADPVLQAARADARSIGGDVLEVRSIHPSGSLMAFVYRTVLEDIQ